MKLLTSIFKTERCQKMCSGRMGMSSARYDRDIDRDSMDFSTLSLAWYEPKGYDPILLLAIDFQVRFQCPFSTGLNEKRMSSPPSTHKPSHVLTLLECFPHTNLMRLGFLVACQYVLRLKPNAVLWGGLPCSLHVWIPRGTSGKSRDNPRGIFNGKFKHECVRIANLLAARYSMLVLVCLVRQVMWVTEQPASSVAPFLPYLEVALYTARQMLGFPAGLLQKLRLSKLMDWKMIAACVCVWPWCIVPFYFHVPIIFGH